MRNKPAKQAFEQTPEQQAFAEQELQKYISLCKLLPTSPTRIPDWRWQMAQVIHEDPFLKKYQRQDQGVKMALRLYKHLQYLDSMGFRRSKRKPFPEGVLDAYALYCRPPRSQAELKARLLAEEPLPDIARKIGSTEAAITWYEHLFFNVSDRLQATSYIELFVIVRSRLKRNHPEFLAAFFMEVGYKLGPVVIDMLVPLQDRILEPLTPSDFIPAEDPHESFLQKVKILIEARWSLFEPIDPQPLLDLRGSTELDHREEQTEQLTRQIQDIQALYTPLANMDLAYDDSTIEQDFYLNGAFPDSTAQTIATKIAV